MTAEADRIGLDTGAWSVVNDGVMGGASTSRVQSVDGALRFEGVIRLEHNGGFASVRRAAALSAAATALAVTVRGDGNRYRLNIYTRDPGTGNARPFTYHAPFATAAGRAERVELPLHGFRAGLRGRAVADAPPLAAADVIGVGLMITKGGHGAGSGPFRLDVLAIEPVAR